MVLLSPVAGIIEVQIRLLLFDVVGKPLGESLAVALLRALVASKVPEPLRQSVMLVLPAVLIANEAGKTFRPP